MKRSAILILLLLALLSACAASEETPTFTIENQGAPVSYPPGILMIGEKAFFVEADGVSFCGLTSCLAEKDGQLLYFADDSSLRRFYAGFVTIDGDLYYAPEDGFALCAAREEVMQIGNALYAFDADCRVMELTAGVQELFGSLYYVAEDGTEISIPPEGPLLTDDGLYCANADGTLATDLTSGYLSFGSDGRYTSGSDTLDRQVEDLLTAAQTGGTDPIEDFRLCYSYIRDHYRYLSMEHYPAGTDDWAQASAETFFELGKGNCYCWAAAQMYCARRLGIQAYVVAGWEDNRTNDHAWVMAEIDGTEYLFDAELEYAIGIPGEMFMVTPDDGAYRGYSYFFP